MDNPGDADLYHRSEREIYIENRSVETRISREHGRHKKKKLDQQFYESMDDLDISPPEETEKDKRMQRFLLAGTHSISL